jgi:hypothetical protein
MVERADSEPTEVEDTKAILKSILEELKGIKDQLARQDERNGLHSNHKPSHYASSSGSGLVSCMTVHTRSNTY